MTIDSAALDDVLSAVDVRLGGTHRRRLDAGDRLPLRQGVPTLVYVVDGDITVDGAGNTACAVDVSACAASPTTRAHTLVTGGALVAFGGTTVRLDSTSGARLTTAEVFLTPPVEATGWPDVIYVAGFARLEPAAAALATHLGPPEGRQVPRSGDPTICRLMVTTVLLSVVRAWAQHNRDGGAGLPASGDEFLERVAAAVRADPGDTWTVDRLAAIGAMSRTVLAQRFRAAFGRTPAGYVTEVRMRRAMDLLAAGQTVSEVSRALGYASDEGFSRAFRRCVGMVPSAWRSSRRTSTTV